MTDRQYLINQLTVCALYYEASGQWNMAKWMLDILSELRKKGA